MPATVLRCPHSHEFTTRAKPGGTTGCPACRRETGRRVSVRVPVSAARATRATEGSGAGELAGAWAAEAPAAPWREQLGGATEWQCQQCGGALHWTGAHTAVYCPACPAWDISPRARQRADEHGQAEARRASRGEVAVRGGELAPADAEAQRQARVKLRAHREALEKHIRQWLDTVADEDSYDRSQWQRQARELGAMLRGYLPEAQAAASVADLASILAEVRELLDGEPGRALREEYTAAQARAEHAWRSQQAAEEYERRQQQAEAEARQRQAEAQRQAAAAAREQAAARQQAEARRRAASNPTVMAGAALADVMALRAARQATLKNKGACQYPHFGKRVAQRLYSVPHRDWGGQMTGQVIGGAPQYRACESHYAAAEAQLEREGYQDVAYWEL